MGLHSVFECHYELYEYKLGILHYYHVLSVCSTLHPLHSCTNAIPTLELKQLMDPLQMPTLEKRPAYNYNCR